ncbi:MAG: RNA polymerase sigma-70 factor [Saprospiraceae bacterium]|nr:RNA polymerase sigma-70 factor [Saprospiraceae bacterium]
MPTGLSKAVFEQFFKEHFNHLCNFARQYVPDADSSKEIVQKVFISVWESREKMDADRLQSYLFTAVKNRCLNFIRDNKKFRSKVLDLECANFDMPQEERDTDTSDLEASFQKALGALPEKCRQVFLMSRIQRKKYKEIAEELDIAQKTVEAHMSKALKTLREALNEYFPLIIISFLKLFVLFIILFNIFLANYQ